MQLKIVSIVISAPMNATNGTFYIAEDYPGAPVTTLGTVVVLPSGLLTSPILTGDLNPGLNYKIKCKLACGTTYVKKYIAPAVCDAPTDLSVELLYTAKFFTGLKFNFTPVPGQTQYHIVIYRNAALGDPDAVFVASYNISTTTGEFIIPNPAVVMTDVDYFIAVATICGQVRSNYSDFFGYTPKKITATVTGSDGSGNRIISLDTNISVPVVVLFQINYKLLDGTELGPVAITLNANHHGAIDLGTATSPGIDPSADAFEIIDISPNPANNYLIIQS